MRRIKAAVSAACQPEQATVYGLETGSVGAKIISGVLNKIRLDVARFGLKTLIIGHGAPIGPESLPANIEYLEAAKAAYASSARSEDFVAAVSKALPERAPEMWLNWSSQMLYGHVAP